MKNKELKILLSAPRGFCAGVERAIEIVEKSIQKYGSPVYVRHEIVHNKFVVDDLRNKGAIFVEELEEIEANRPRGKKLMLDLLMQRSTLVDYPTMHTDDALLEVADERGIPLLTVDANLKRRALENGIGILEVVKGKSIRLVNGL